MSTPPATAADDTRKGLLAVVLAFLIWGNLPLYMRALDSVLPWEIMVHRLLWACVFTLALLAIRRQLAHVLAIMRQPRALAWLLASALMISVNWLVYVWAVAERQVVEASLGYFINPLVSVALGVLLLGERLNRWQTAAVVVAALGVVWLTLRVGRLPWIALMLAFSFAFYGFIRKRVAVDAITGLCVETLLLAPLALAYLFWLGKGGAFGTQGLAIDGLLVGAGIFTAVPLMAFAFGVRRIALSTAGIIQYLAPTLQLLIAVLWFAEPFTWGQAVGFGLIWLALALYVGDGLRRHRRAAAVQCADAVDAAVEAPNPTR
jgi:chloramphenicol-sensitive protein RarD